MPSYNEFKQQTLWKSFDVDGFPAYQKYQCWDYVSGVYFPYIGGFKISCTKTGYVKDIANQRATNGILDFCTDIGLQAELQPGDICIWGNSPECPLSHIAIYDHDEGQNAVYFLGQNQPYTYVTVKQIPVGGIIGVFRPDIFMGKNPEPAPKPAPKKADQILSKGSKVTSHGFYVERMDYQNHTFYNNWAGGWIPWADVDEIDASDGAKDQWIRVGSGVAFNKGVMTVNDLKIIGGRWCAKCDKLDYWVTCACLFEVED